MRILDEAYYSMEVTNHLEKTCSFQPSICNLFIATHGEIIHELVILNANQSFLVINSSKHVIKILPLTTKK